MFNYVVYMVYRPPVNSPVTENKHTAMILKSLFTFDQMEMKTIKHVCLTVVQLKGSINF